MRFFTYPKDSLPDLSCHILLTINAPPLTEKDKASGIFLIDATWKHADTMFDQLQKPHVFSARSLPAGFQTAYPRRQEDCSDPMRGLASIEALYIAYRILGRNSEGLLDHYYWKEAFLKKNKQLLENAPS